MELGFCQARNKRVNAKMYPKGKVSMAPTWTGCLPQGKNEASPRGHLGGAEENPAADFFFVFI